MHSVRVPPTCRHRARRTLAAVLDDVRHVHQVSTLLTMVGFAKQTLDGGNGGRVAASPLAFKRVVGSAVSSPQMRAGTTVHGRSNFTGPIAVC